MDATYLVKFANRSAVQHFQEARDILAELILEMPFLVELDEMESRLTDAWEGLTFTEEDDE